jgi:hypothetical protein
MPKVVSCSRRRPGLTRADFQRYIQFIHGTLSNRVTDNMPDFGSYMQNHVIDGAFGVLSDATHMQIADRDVVVELAYEDWQKLHRGVDHPDIIKYIATDGKYFADEPNTIVMVMNEEEIPVPNPLGAFNPGAGLVTGVGAGKVMQYLKRDEHCFREDYYQFWKEAHEYAMDRSPFCRQQLRRYVQNIRLHQTGNTRRHFGTTAPDYDGVASYWFDSPEYFGAFREYNEALMAFPKTWVDWSQSFFLYVKQIPITPPKPGSSIRFC